ncbi:type IX secretion system membrane protein PorP/SprF [Sunxiuqinia sp. A32]|uniref:type IX secretion system membrane protein PorP/SprF n=1 Tax=Sunxiuqinia sp. A32 TaxID=3461496 RepID=UPI0040452150
MLAPLRISLIFFSLLPGLSSFAQYFSDIQEYNQLLLMNPSYTGTTFGTRIHANVFGQRSAFTSTYTNTISADFYLEDEQIGLGVYGGVRNNADKNTFSLWGQGAYSKILKIKSNQYFIPSISAGFEQPLKNISLFVYDIIVRRSTEPHQPPGYSMQQPLRTTLKTGFLLATYDWNIGLSAGANWDITQSIFPEGDMIFRAIIHAEKFITYYHRGLLSKKYYLKPRFIIDYSTERMQVYSDLNIQRFNWLGSIGILHNLENNRTRIALSAGYDFESFKLNYHASSQFPADGNFEVIHSFSLRLTIPELNKKYQPIYPLVRDL